MRKKSTQGSSFIMSEGLNQAASAMMWAEQKLTHLVLNFNGAVFKSLN